MKRILLSVQIISLAWLTQACFDVQYQDALKNTPSSTNARSFLGEWRSANPSSFPTAQSCGDLVWNVTSQDATRIAGNFEATCAGGAKLTGTASAVIGNPILLDANGMVTGMGPISCPFTLAGTGIPQTDASIRVEYIGSTCVGPISGTEVIRR
jgi:hypothetical protein